MNGPTILRATEGKILRTENPPRTPGRDSSSSAIIGSVRSRVSSVIAGSLTSRTARAYDTAVRRLSDAQISSRTVQPVLAFADAQELPRSALLARADLVERDVADKDTSVP